MFSLAKHFIRRMIHRAVRSELSDVDSRVASLEATIRRLTDDTERQRRNLQLLSRKVISRPNSPLPPIREGGFRHDEVFILGSGPSMLELSEADKRAIQAGFSVAMNRYLVFWDMVGIWPSYQFLADSRGVGWRVFEKTVDLIFQRPSHEWPVLLLESAFEATVPEELPVVFFQRDDRDGTQSLFAETLDDPMFFHRGSLTSLLNLVWVLRLAPRIRLVGIDLNRPGTFFESQQEIQRGGGLFNAWDELAKSQGVHATVAKMESVGWGSGSMLDEFETLIRHLDARGVSVRSTNRDSLLVAEELCPFTPLVTYHDKPHSVHASQDSAHLTE